MNNTDKNDENRNDENKSESSLTINDELTGVVFGPGVLVCLKNSGSWNTGYCVYRSLFSSPRYVVGDLINFLSIYKDKGGLTTLPSQYISDFLFYQKLMAMIKLGHPSSPRLWEGHSIYVIPEKLANEVPAHFIITVDLGKTSMGSPYVEIKENLLNIKKKPANIEKIKRISKVALGILLGVSIGEEERSSTEKVERILWKGYLDSLAKKIDAKAVLIPNLKTLNKILEHFSQIKESQAQNEENDTKKESRIGQEQLQRVSDLISQAQLG